MNLDITKKIELLSNNAAVTELIKVLKTLKSGIRDNKELDIYTRGTWLNMIDEPEMATQKTTFEILFKYFAEGEETSKTFALKLINVLDK